MPTDEPPYRPEDHENKLAVIEAYETGQLKLLERKGGECALFWGGRLIRGWHERTLEHMRDFDDLWEKYGSGRGWLEDVGILFPLLALFPTDWFTCLFVIGMSG